MSVLKCLVFLSRSFAVSCFARRQALMSTVCWAVVWLSCVFGYGDHWRSMISWILPGLRGCRPPRFKKKPHDDVFLLTKNSEKLLPQIMKTALQKQHTTANNTDNKTKLRLEDWQIKELLVDIEKAGGRLVKGDFLNVCNQSNRIYGSPGSDLRRAFQKILSNYNRHKPLSYLNLLQQYDIQPSPATQREVEEFKKHQQKKDGEFVVSAVCSFYVVVDVVLFKRSHVSPFYFCFPVQTHT